MFIARGIVSVAWAFLMLASGCATDTSHARTSAHIAPRFGHVFIIMLENESFDATFAADSPAPYLGQELVGQGALLRQYHGIGHYSLDNYIAMISGQAPNPDTQFDCRVFNEFAATDPALDANGQLRGAGCVYPTSVKTLADQLDAANFSWKAYMEDMGNDPTREAPTCGHAAIGGAGILRAQVGDQYVDKHNPFVYFHSIIDDQKRCDSTVVNLKSLTGDLTHSATTPNYTYITPNLCHDGHDAPCVDGAPGGLVSADAFLREWVPKIMQSPAYREDGLLIITFDEALLSDATACCAEQDLPGGRAAGLGGPGGGRIGAVLLSPRIKPGAVSDTPYNHYSLLRFIEDNFGVAHLGYAGAPGLAVFGADVFGR
jgi:phosphatidylinositol-3-phosphatase